MSNDIDNVTPKGVLLVVSGPSGAGKGTICQMLRDQLPDLGYSISVTTRAPRTGEVDGESYFFKTIPEVKQMIEKRAAGICRGIRQLLRHTAQIRGRAAGIRP